MKLAELEARFHALVTAPESVTATLAARGEQATGDVHTLVVGDARLSAVERLEIYANMYFFRIRDVLRDELPRTAALLGDSTFHDLVVDYLAARPPRHPSLREVGARLPAFLAEHPTGRARPWLAELARLERARLELVDAADAHPLTLDDARTMAPAELVRLPLLLVPAHVVLENRYQIAPLWRALTAVVEESAEENAEESATDRSSTAGAASTLEPPAAIQETLLVWRIDSELRHRPVDGDERAWLRRLTAGATFEQLCELAPPGTPDDLAAAQAYERLGRLVAEGLLRPS
jgi:hypothetical protein